MNWIIAISDKAPQNIRVLKESTTADVFASFFDETIKKLQQDGIESSKIVLVFDNASVNIAEKVNQVIWKLQCLAVTLPPYTPEWNNSEVAINIIKSRIDRELKQNRYELIV